MKLDAHKIQAVPSHNRGAALRMLAAASVVFHFVASPALAQSPGRLPDEDGGILQYVVGVVLVGLVSVSAFIKSGRSHQG